MTKRLQAVGAQETLLERIAGWCLWITVWGPILAILTSFQDGTEYSFFIAYRQVVFPALLVQICLRLAQPSGLSIWKTIGLVARCTAEPYSDDSPRERLAVAGNQCGNSRLVLHGRRGSARQPSGTTGRGRI